MSLHRLERLKSTPSDSRLQEILNYNIPTDILPDSEQFQEALTDCDCLVLELERQVRTAQQALDDSKNAVNVAKSYAYKLRSLFHPIRTFPTDILIEIFRHCVPSSLQAVEEDSLDPKSPPWVLSHVCRRWRAISVSDPHLWCGIYLPLNEYRHVRASRVVYGLGVLLSRSNGCDISLLVEEMGDSIKSPKFFSTLRSAFGRVRIMNLVLRFQTFQDHFSLQPFADTSVLPFTYDRLSSLSVTFAYDARVPAHLSETLAPSHLLEAFAPVLTSFTTFNGPQISVPVNHLRFYKTDLWPGWELLRRMTLLQELRVSLASPAALGVGMANLTSIAITTGPLESEPLLFDSMTSLSIEEVMYGGIFSRTEYVTKRMRLPQLATLSVRYLSRSAVQLPKLYHPEVLTRLHLCISWSTWRVDDIDAFLQSTINVEDMELEDSTDSSPPETSSLHILQQMTIMDSAGPNILPRLKKLALSPCTTLSLQESVVEMVVSRAIFRQGNSDIPKCSISVLNVHEFEKAWESVMLQNEEWREAAANVSFGFGDAFPQRCENI